MCVARLFRKWLDGQMPDGIEVVYISPLKALSNDIQRNLQTPLAEIAALAAEAGYAPRRVWTDPAGLFSLQWLEAI